MVLAELAGRLNPAEVKSAFMPIEGMGQPGNYGDMLVEMTADMMEEYYMEYQLCGVLSRVIVSRPDLPAFLDLMKNTLSSSGKVIYPVQLMCSCRIKSVAENCFMFLVTSLQAFKTSK